jgi:hypothetical protein
MSGDVSLSKQKTCTRRTVAVCDLSEGGTENGKSSEGLHGWNVVNVVNVVKTVGWRVQELAVEDTRLLGAFIYYVVKSMRLSRHNASILLPDIFPTRINHGQMIGPGASSQMKPPCKAAGTTGFEPEDSFALPPDVNCGSRFN